jgi:hypothetical protein
MSQKIYKNVPSGDVEKFCKRHMKFGATKCEPTDKGNGKFDVLVEYPDV